MPIIRNDYPELLDSQLHWQPGQIAAYTRADGQHISYVVWLDTSTATA